MERLEKFSIRLPNGKIILTPEKTCEYREKVKDMMKLPWYKNNKFLQDILNWIESHSCLSISQAKAIDRMDEEERE